jgi:aerobic-type carbon monoxide dehydrogenase small subunit (CoxS/CutS family)
MFAAQAEGTQIVTVEGLAHDPAFDDLRAAFRKHHALQCGFCTPGFLTTLAAWLARDPEPDETALREELSGTLCRCTGYVGIVDAALEVATARRADKEIRDA